MITYVYDGTQFRFVSWGTELNTTYSQASLGQGYGTCSTAAATVAKVVTLSSYALSNGGIVSVKFTYAVPASATMNINSKGAKAIYYRGAAIVADVIKAGDIATFIYDGTRYHLLSIDRWQADLDGKAASSHKHSAADINTSSTLGARVNANATATATLANVTLRNIYAKTTDMTAGSTALTTGAICLIYE